MPRKLSHLQAVLVAEAPHRLYLDGAGGLVLPHRECLRPNQLEHPVSPQNLLEQKSLHLFHLSIHSQHPAPARCPMLKLDHMDPIGKVNLEMRQGDGTFQPIPPPRRQPGLNQLTSRWPLACLCSTLKLQVEPQGGIW